MIVPVFDHPEVVKRFVAAGLFGEGAGFGEATAIGFATETAGLVAGVVYHNYDPSSSLIEISAISTHPGWLTRATLSVIFGYPFDQLGCRLVVARHSEHNARVRRIWHGLGATETRLPRLRGDDEDEILSVLHRDTWQKSKFKEIP